MTILVGTRGSALATAQAGHVAGALAEHSGEDAQLVTVTTHGDTSRESLSTIGGTGVFATALREALAAKVCDVVVHSMKDLPTAPAPELTVAGVPEREDPRDALCARDGLTLAELPTGARIGTGSIRRAAQLRRLRPDVDVVDIRGNVDTRLGYVTSGELDAVVLAVSGLVRLGRTEAITERFDLETWPTAPAQGALAIEIRTSSLADERIMRAILGVHHAESALATTAERAVLARLEAGCTAPIGAHAVVVGGELRLTAAVYAVDGSDHLVRTQSVALPAATVRSAADADTSYDGTDTAIRERAARELGSSVAEALLANGAAALAPLG